MGKWDNKRIVFGVTGSIAAYKAVSLLRTLVEEGANVSVVMTSSATQFVAPLTFEVLSKKRHGLIGAISDRSLTIPS